MPMISTEAPFQRIAGLSQRGRAYATLFPSRPGLLPTHLSWISATGGVRITYH